MWPPRSPPTVTGVRAIAVSHRIGTLQIGDAALVAAVAADHRARRSRPARGLVDTVKARLPVWKHQFFADGSEEWVGLRLSRRSGRRQRCRRRAADVGSRRPEARAAGGAGGGGGATPDRPGLSRQRSAPGPPGVRRGQRPLGQRQQRILAADVLGLDRVPDLLQVRDVRALVRTPARSDPSCPGRQVIRARQVRNASAGTGSSPVTAWLAASNAGAGC